jgi:hypothetical protein
MNFLGDSKNYWVHIRLLLIVNTSSRVEKYRPKELDDVVGNSDTIDRLKVIAKEGNCPHIILSVGIEDL